MAVGDPREAAGARVPGSPFHGERNNNRVAYLTCGMICWGWSLVRQDIDVLTFVP